jgi:hypothetical protein
MSSAAKVAVGASHPWYANIVADLESWGSSLFGTLEGDAATAAKQETALVASAVQSALPTLAEDELTALTSGNIADQSKVVGGLVTQVGASLVTGTEQIGLGTVVNGVNAAVTSIQTAAAAAKQAAGA